MTQPADRRDERGGLGDERQCPCDERRIGRRAAPRPLRVGPLATVGLLGLLLCLVNVSSVLTEAQGRIAVWEPFVWEGSSLAILVAMAPAIGAAVRRWPPDRKLVGPMLLIHAALTVPFALVHVTGAFLMRSAVYQTMGARYDFFGSGVGERILYEWRKDVLVYAGIALVYVLFRPRGSRELTGAADERIEIGDGAHRLFLKPTEILMVEAAGNYVEFHLDSRTHLVRGSLRTREGRLAGCGLVRVHRARLVNRARIVSIRRFPGGHCELTLDDGRVAGGSRRYGRALETVGD